MTSIYVPPRPTGAWQKGTVYPPGSIVFPTTGLGGTATAPTNADFESGSLTGWAAGTDWAYDASRFYSGAGCATLSAGTAETLVNNNHVAVTPGQTINAYCMMYGGGTALAAPTGFLSIRWYDAGSSFISSSDSATAHPVQVPGWNKITVSGSAPANAAFAALAFTGTITTNSLSVDFFNWDYVTPSVTPHYFTATQSSTGTSGPIEPDWTASSPIADGSVSWTRGVQSSILWQAIPLCYTGTAEPTWSTTAKQMTVDGFVIASLGSGYINWECNSPIILDTNCPQSKYVVAAASKVFAADNDIVRYSATTDPQDWTSEADAGFLPTGLQTHGANPATAMGLYRSNLVVFNSEGFQMWQLDEDPENMALLDAMPIGCTFHKSLAPVNNDLFFLSAQGVRTMGISAGSGSLSAGDVGMPIDPVIQAGIAYAKANNVDPLAVYYPSQGQYWIVFPGWQVPASLFTPIASSGLYSTGDSVFVYTISRSGEVGAWNRYVFPFAISAFCFNADDLLIRSGDDVLKVDPAALQDYAADNYLGSSRATNFPCAVQWPYLDFGQIGTTKKFDTMDIACSQNTGVTVTLYYDQTNAAAATTPFTMSGDSIPGMQIPIPVMCPSLSIRLGFASSDQWQLYALNVNLQDLRPTA